MFVIFITSFTSYIRKISTCPLFLLELKNVIIYNGNLLISEWVCKLVWKQVRKQVKQESKWNKKHIQTSKSSKKVCDRQATGYIYSKLNCIGPHASTLAAFEITYVVNSFTEPSSQRNVKQARKPSLCPSVCLSYHEGSTWLYNSHWALVCDVKSVNLWFTCWCLH